MSTEIEKCECNQEDCPVCDTECKHCGGEQFVWQEEESDFDPLWDEPGLIRCPNCHGSGKAKDMTFW